ncbi:hypothetical protein MKK88_07405 [Methylobacterium sp. E-005]|uniref:hypothetical protein n=1 Tax=Methylobacterium sp. E-005 TaxID=2836549 RepID=UPI001FB8F79D|nr:hypothetical protein [Methylobacterium sp. E-005]MCJ2085818.1 hypothetical protein [Methylobacterium sp. E-005]
MSAISAEAHLDKIRQAVIRSRIYRVDNDALRSAPSDVLDGWAFAREVQPLVDRGILATVPVELADQTLGNAVSWCFTDKGMQLASSWLGDRRAPDTGRAA